MSRRKVCVVLVDRANYGRLKPVMRAIDDHPEMEMQVVAAGTMVLGRFGKPVEVVRADGFRVDSEVYLELEGSTPATMAKSVGFGVVEFASEFQRLGPDLVVLIGDRYEALAAAIAAALQGVIFAYDGWTGMIYFSGEVRDPAREIPRALAGGLVATIGIYVLLNAAILAVLPLDAIAGSPLAAATAMGAIVGDRGALLVQLLIALALPSALVANTLCASRVAFALGQDRLAPPICGRVNEGGTPAVSLVVTAAATALLLLTGTFERLIAICAFILVDSYAL
jgi:amino acid transporter